jgi:hypothetical protein
MKIDSTARQISDLRTRIDEIAEELRQVRQAFASPPLPGWLPALTPREDQMLRLLVSRTTVSLAMFEAVIGGASLDPDNLFKVYIMKLRQKLLPAGIEIETRTGHGYELSRASRSILAPAPSSAGGGA